MSCTIWLFGFWAVLGRDSHSNPISKKKGCPDKTWWRVHYSTFRERALVLEITVPLYIYIYIYMHIMLLFFFCFVFLPFFFKLFRHKLYFVRQLCIRVTNRFHKRAFSYSLPGIRAIRPSKIKIKLSVEASQKWLDMGNLLWTSLFGSLIARIGDGTPRDSRQTTPPSSSSYPSDECVRVCVVHYERCHQSNGQLTLTYKIFWWWVIAEHLCSSTYDVEGLVCF